MSLHHSPRIVNDGLVLCLDAANIKSYPGTGTDWSDLSSTRLIGEGVNSPVFNTTGNISSFEFNGLTNSRLFRIQNNTQLDTQTPSVEVWIKTNNTNQNGFWFEKGTVNTQYSLFQEGTTIRWRANLGSGFVNLASATTATYMNTNDWYQVVGTFVSGNAKLYVNNLEAGSGTSTGTIATNAGGCSMGVHGGYSGGRGYWYNGNIAIVRVYNRTLSSAEIQQNFNALRGRFGI
jgi:hypothetical protein